MPKSPSRLPVLQKALTGIEGFDEITGGGLPAGRTSLVCGSAGCGKSLFSLEFLIRGATEFGEPGVLLTFDETLDDIRTNVASLGFDIDRLIAQKKLHVDFVKISRHEIDESGDYDLEGLFIRLSHAIARVKARRVVIDTLETLFAGLSNQALLRSELRRLFTWLKERNLTSIVTGERGEGTLTRHGLEEYVSDCVILLDHRIVGQVSTRRLRVVKYRGSTHGTNEYPFLIDEQGITVFPITSTSLDYEISSERVPTGVPGLDDMLGGGGYFRGSTVLLSGTAGSGKTSIAAQLAYETCRRGEKCLYLSFEESPAQIIRNMRSIGTNLEPFVRKGLLAFHSTRPTMLGIEMHLVRIYKLITQLSPSVVIVDPISNIRSAGTQDESSQMLLRLVDFLRKRNILGLLASLTSGSAVPLEGTDEGISSMVDTWILVRSVESSGERNRLLYVLKSRGMPHSNQVREFLITSRGLRLIDPYLGPEGVLTGSARVAQEARAQSQAQLQRDDAARRKLALQNRRRSVEAQIEALRAGLHAEEEEFHRENAAEAARNEQRVLDREAMADSRNVSGKRLTKQKL